MTSTVSASTTTTSPARGLICRACGAEYPIAAQHACYECFGPLEVSYDPAALARVTREEIEAGPKSIWRYAGLLPVGQDPATRVTLNPGYTPLISAPELAAAIGLTAPLWVKDDSANPTHSFKDRVVSSALTAARGLGFTRFACASTGNLANSVAAHAARAGAPSIVFIPGDLEPGKIVTTAVYGGDVVAIDGSYDDVNRLCGELLTKIDKAFTELVEIGLVDAPKDGWRVFGAQSAGCNPIATALRTGSDRVVPVKPTGIAKSLNIGDPAAGAYAIEAVQRTGGWMDDADDDEIRVGIRLLARTTGVFAETAGGVTVAVLKKLVQAGRLDPGAETVVFNTGEGLKTLDAVADLVGPSHRIKPSLRGARAAGLLG